MAGKPQPICRKCGAAKPAGFGHCLPCRRAYNADYSRRRGQRPEIKAQKREIARRYVRPPESRERKRAIHAAWKRTLDGQRSVAESGLRRQYGIDFHDWALLYEEQHGRCGGCRERLRFDRKTHVDHCHRSGRVRGLLCSDCNQVLGRAKDMPETLRRLAAYVEHDQAQMAADLTS